jgi:Protein of unknown function (DUF1320)
MYLRAHDYERFIQTENFGQILSNNDSLRILTEGLAQEQCNSYLVDKYLTTAEFTDTNPFLITDTYSGLSRVDLSGYSEYDDTVSYLATNKTIVIHDESVYIILSDTTGTFNPSDWVMIGSFYDLFYVKTPYKPFNFYDYYNIGDKVYYKGKVYLAKKTSFTADHQTDLNSITYNNVPPENIFPGDPKQGVTYWGVGVDYSFSGILPSALPTDYSDWTAGSYSIGEIVNYNGIIVQSLINSNDKEPLTDITSWQPIYWTKGDNRSQQLVAMMIDISLYHLHSRIAPQNIPELRVKRYDAAIEWLDKAVRGVVIPNLPARQPIQGNIIRWGSKTKLNNTY